MSFYRKAAVPNVCLTKVPENTGEHQKTTAEPLAVRQDVTQNQPKVAMTNAQRQAKWRMNNLEKARRLTRERMRAAYRAKKESQLLSVPAKA